MGGKLQFQFDFARPGQDQRRKTQSQRILVLADCSGQQPDKPGLSARQPRPVDAEHLDGLLAKLAPQLRLALEDGGGELSIEFGKLDDFHPDALYQRLAAFQPMRELRGRLANPSTYAEAAEALKHGRLASPSAPSPAPAHPETRTEDGSLLEQLLGAPSHIGEPPRKPAADPAQNLIQRLVAPHLGSSVDLGQQKQFFSAVDAASTELMGRILHHPRFQSLEATWRGIAWLAENLEDAGEVAAYLLDVSYAELCQDWLEAGGKLENTAICRLLAESSLAVPGNAAWSLVVGDYPFGEDVDSLGLLAALGALSGQCGGSFIAEANPKLLGCASLAASPDAAGWTQAPADVAQAWQALRQSPVASSIGLALPRLMLRRPYGKKSDPVDSFDFEELPPRPAHEHYLWGNPAFACAALAAQSWLGDDGETANTLEGLPYHVYDDGSGLAVKPCAEAYLNEKTAYAILDSGIMPLISVRNQNHALIPRLQSIAQPPTALV